MSDQDLLNEVLEKLTHQLAAASEPALRRAYAEGYKKGMQDARDNISELLSAKASQQLPAILGANSVPSPENLGGVRRSPPLRGVVNHKRRYAYGSVIGAMRKALQAHSDQGITREGMRQWCKAQFDLEISASSARETLKRLSGDNEAIYHDKVWWPGEAIKEPEPEENEPHNGRAVGGSEVGSLFGTATRQ